MSLGLYDEARAEFEAVRLSVQGDAAQSYRLANYMLEIGMYRTAIMTARQILDLAGMNDADTLNAPSYLNRIRFGTFYSDLVLAIGQAIQPPPLIPVQPDPAGEPVRWVRALVGRGQWSDADHAGDGQRHRRRPGLAERLLPRKI